MPKMVIAVNTVTDVRLAATSVMNLKKKLKQEPGTTWRVYSTYIKTQVVDLIDFIETFPGSNQLCDTYQVLASGRVMERSASAVPTNGEDTPHIGSAFNVSEF